MSGSASKGFSISISAVDNASKQIDAINRRLVAMRAPTERLQKSFSKLADNTGVAALARGMRDVADASFRAFENLGRMVAPLGVLTGAASIAGIYKLIGGFSEAGSRLLLAGQRARISAGDLASFEGAARLAGASSEAMGQGVKELNDNIFHAAQGTAPDAIIAFDKLGVSWHNADGSLRKVADVMPEVIDKLSKIEDPTFRAQIATMLFSGAAEGLAPVLRLSRQEFEAYVTQAKHYGTMTDDGTKKAWALQQAQLRLTEAVSGLALAVGEALSPVLGPLLDSLSEWTADNRALIGQDIGGWVSSAIPQIGSFATKVNEIAKALGGWQVVLETLGALIVGGWALRMVAGLSPLTLALAGIALTIEKISSFQERTAPANLPVGSPFWDNVSEREQGNLVNSPRSQEFFKSVGVAEPFSWMRPNTWFGSSGGTTHPSPLAADTTMDADKRALLDAISIPESKTAYDAQNPNSSAHGRYQFIDSTDSSVTRQTGLPGQDPVSQDQKGWFLADREYRANTGRDLLTDYRSGKYAEIAAGLNKTWPSMPGGSQQNTSMRQWIDRNIDARAAEQQRDRTMNVAPSAPPANVGGGTGAPPAPAAPATQTLKGSADLRVRIEPAPGLTARTTSSTAGDLFSGAPRIETVMPF